MATDKLPIPLWHEAMGEATVADAVLDRVLQHLHRIELEGESMRRPEGAAKPDGTGGARDKRPGPTPPSQPDIDGDGR